MMEKLLSRGTELASQGQQQKLHSIAGQLHTFFGNATVQIDSDQVVISGRGILKRWLTDPAVRFLAGGLR